MKVSKGVRLDKDQESAFDDTGLGSFLRAQQIEQLWIGGLAQEVCVRASVLAAAREGFRVHLIEEATRPIDRERGSDALEEMRRLGTRIERSGG